LFLFIPRVKSDSENEDHEDDMSLPFTKKAQSKSKTKSGRRPKWNIDDVGDLVDIFVNSGY